PSSSSAVELLADLVAMYDEGRREPLPLPVKTSFAWADAVHEGRDPERNAAYRWRSNGYPGEDAEPAYQLAFGKNAWVRDLVARGLDTNACRLWLPMLKALQ
ncbi:hypothetical protein, partial [Mycolicibacterium pulveris]